MFISVVLKSESLSRIALLVGDRVEVVIRGVLFVFVLDGVVYFVTVVVIERFIVWDLFMLKL